MPRSLFTEAALANLNALVAAKGGLIRKALGIAQLPVEISTNKTYEHFICAFCNMACNQKRITAKEKETDNDKYAFRCFRLRLGLIVAEYIFERKILLGNLSESSAFKGGAKYQVFE